MLVSHAAIMHTCHMCMLSAILHVLRVLVNTWLYYSCILMAVVNGLSDICTEDPNFWPLAMSFEYPSFYSEWKFLLFSRVDWKWVDSETLLQQVTYMYYHIHSIDQPLKFFRRPIIGVSIQHFSKGPQFYFWDGPLFERRHYLSECSQYHPLGPQTSVYHL